MLFSEYFPIWLLGISLFFAAFSPISLKYRNATQREYLPLNEEPRIFTHQNEKQTHLHHPINSVDPSFFFFFIFQFGGGTTILQNSIPGRGFMETSSVGIDNSAVTAFLLTDATSWWQEINVSPLWQDRIFFTLAALYGVVAIVALVRFFSLFLISFSSCLCLLCCQSLFPIEFGGIGFVLLHGIFGYRRVSG